jgi:aminopeptidase N
VQVENPAEIDALFDGAIVYAKGARMLVMVRSLIGDDALRTGLKNYFELHKYGNATGPDLWNSLAMASGIDVGTIMQSWLEQPGYPVVTAMIDNGQLVLTQNQFFIGEGQDQGRQWQIPLKSNYADVPGIMTGKRIVIGDYQQLRDQAGVPFRLNVGNDSHFIVKYDDTLMADILAHVDQLDAIAQLQLLQDQRLLAQGRQISYADVVPLLQQFAANPATIVNDALYRVAGDLKQFVTPQSEEEQRLQQLYDRLSRDQVQRLGWTAKPDESHVDQLTRPFVLNAALYAQNATAITDAHALFVAHENQLGTLPADTRTLILTNEVKHYGSTPLFDHLLDEYRTTSDASYKSSICVALTSTPDVQLITRLIQQFEDATTIKPQDLRAWFRGVLSNPVGQQAAWDWLRTDWGWLEKTVGGDMEFTTYITVIAGIFKTQTRFDEFKAFFEPKINTPGLTREITMDLTVIGSRVALVTNEQDAVNAAIQQAI